jgi:hypothetical protein
MALNRNGLGFFDFNDLAMVKMQRQLTRAAGIHDSAGRAFAEAARAVAPSIRIAEQFCGLSKSVEPIVKPAMDMRTIAEVADASLGKNVRMAMDMQRAAENAGRMMAPVLVSEGMTVLHDTGWLRSAEKIDGRSSKLFEGRAQAKRGRGRVSGQNGMKGSSSRSSRGSRCAAHRAASYSEIASRSS